MKAVFSVQRGQMIYFALVKAYHDSAGDILDSPEIDREEEHGRDEDADEGGRREEAAEQVDDDGAQAEENVEEGDEGVSQLPLRSEPLVLEFHAETSTRLSKSNEGLNLRSLANAKHIVEKSS